MPGAVATPESVSGLKAHLDFRLMRHIFGRWGATIWNSCRYSSVPPEFLAALIANESGGDPEKTCLDLDVRQRLLAVRSGSGLAYGDITRKDLLAVGDEHLTDLATLWGLSQIMGSHLLYQGKSPRRLLEPEPNLHETLQLLAILSQHCQLDLRNDFEDLFRYWSNGRPEWTGRDPGYVEDGLRRLEIYRKLSTPLTPNSEQWVQKVAVYAQIPATTLPTRGERG